MTFFKNFPKHFENHNPPSPLWVICLNNSPEKNSLPSSSRKSAEFVVVFVARKNDRNKKKWYLGFQVFSYAS